MKELKKGQSGEAARFISRTRAVRKLQLSLADFRRLCILKGIYPREPKHRSKVSGGSSAPRTYYHVKDINFLAHEPLLKKFRDFKVYLRKLKKAKAKQEDVQVARLEKARPVYKLDNIIKERYPTFVDALRDLDDALSMVFLFAQMPQTNQIQADMVAKCKRLSDELLHFVIHMHGLRKVFLSIKGIYYQAEVHGQPLTWITPYRFSTAIPTDVDFRVMLTFLEFYTSVLGFVNCHLYTQSSLAYPPKIDAVLDQEDAGLGALIVEQASVLEPEIVQEDEDMTPAEQRKRMKSTEARIATLDKVLSRKSSTAMQDDDDDDDDDEAAAAAESGAMDEFPEQMEGGDTTVPGLKEAQMEMEEDEKLAKLFDGLHFFLNRETPKYSLEFAIRSLGGGVSWQGMAVSETRVVGQVGLSEESEKITHQIVDRPTFKGTLMSRAYIQPQWIYDCINAKKILPTAQYAPGAVLPPHLSPFAQEGADDYIPPERLAQLQQEAASMREDLGEEDEDVDVDDDDDDEDDVDEDDDEELNEEEAEEALYQQELEAEARGEQYASVFKKGDKAMKKVKKAKSTKKQQAMQKQQKKESEEEEMAAKMLTRKTRNVYQKLKKGKADKQAEVETLTRKRKSLDQASKVRAKAAKGKAKAKPAADAEDEAAPARRAPSTRQKRMRMATK